MINFKSLIQKFPSVWPTYWNNKWKKSKILYETISLGENVDVRTILEPTNAKIIVEGKKIRGLLSDDEVALNCLRYVVANIRYLSDKTKYQKVEYWQPAPSTYQLKTGDCEDGAILLMKLMEAAGIPAWRRKLCCGWVVSGTKKGGHAYVIYLADDFKWYCMDWCYWPLDSISCFLKKSHSERKQYLDIWWTFNEEFSWCQHDTIIKRGN